MPKPDNLGENKATRKIVLFGKALADPIRVRMLGLLAEGRGCCGSPPVGLVCGTNDGICVCELQAYFGLGQSKISYHLRVLKEAGLVKETSRGKWTLYAADKKAAGECLEAVRSRMRL